MGPEEVFLKWAATKTPEYVSGWLDGLFLVASCLKNINENMAPSDALGVSMDEFR